MFRVLTCLAFEHNWWLVALAAIICFISSYSYVAIGRQARDARNGQRLGWILIAGAAAGFGIWSTHFVAMLAYDPGVVVGYDTELTILSLGVAIALTAAGLALALTWKTQWSAAAGGAVVGGGVAGMHYLGMWAMQLPGQITWAPDLVIASIALGAGLAALAFMTARRHRGATGDLAATLLLTLAICSLHFTGMGAVTIVADPTRAISGSTLDPQTMAYAVAIAAIGVIGGALVVALIARQALAERHASERRFSLLVQGVSDYAIYMLDRGGCVANWNAGAERAKGYAANEIVGQHFSRFYSEADRALGTPEKALATALAEGRFEDEGWRFRKDGTGFWAHVAIDVIRDDNGEFVGFAKITRDCTRQKADADRIREVSRTLDLALSNMSQGLCLFDPAGRLALTNRRLAEIFQMAPDAVPVGTSFQDLFSRIVAASGGSTTDAQRMHQRHRGLIAGRDSRVVVEEFSAGRSISISHRPVADGSFVSTFEDISERRRSEQKIAHMARHDALTGLPNRAYFNDHLDHELERASKTPDKIAVIGIDLNRFKEINDLHGHAAGDEVLEILSQRMTETLGEGEFVARFGGDEFAAVKRFTQQADLMDFLERLEACLFGHVKIGEFDIAPGASIGVALYPADATIRETLVNNADLAMYRAKTGLNQTICFYEARMDEAARTRRALAKDLWAGIERKQFSLFYQVQKSVATGETIGYEVLLRWLHPERGMVPPSEFIPIAEECGAIVPLGEWVLRTACTEAARWLHPYKIAVNLSPVQIGHVDLVALVSQVLAETGLAPSLLELEITETTIIADKTRALHILRQIKALGVTIAIDDFGTGYSSLDTLRSFPFDKIKLDRTFMTEVETSPQAKAIIRAILALGRSLNVPVLAEGVETEDQLALLHLEGCDEAQGYLLGRPKPQADIHELIRRAKTMQSPGLAPDAANALGTGAVQKA
ncbi:bifunctional diguanylate cyclase/phosphodiesterase [Phreatobacter stygius]|uniref:EAL domain-containing protein n=1 Tax=Phreatobacter stygius TaxID=1940610 RepID=A0A4D7B447_9HYPH|nr:EAL domain-containing protein [Phreatobacter stygius]QCI67691.1 EAL domain-containing protein [Phreatobacter stygius]